MPDHLLSGPLRAVSLSPATRRPLSAPARIAPAKCRTCSSSTLVSCPRARRVLILPVLLGPAEGSGSLATNRCSNSLEEVLLISRARLPGDLPLRPPDPLLACSRRSRSSSAQLASTTATGIAAVAVESVRCLHRDAVGPPDVRLPSRLNFRRPLPALPRCRASFPLRRQAAVVHPVLARPARTA